MTDIREPREGRRSDAGSALTRFHDQGDNTYAEQYASHLYLWSVSDLDWVKGTGTPTGQTCISGGTGGTGGTGGIVQQGARDLSVQPWYVDFNGVAQPVSSTQLPAALDTGGHLKMSIFASYDTTPVSIGAPADGNPVSDYRLYTNSTISLLDSSLNAGAGGFIRAPGTSASGMFVQVKNSPSVVVTSGSVTVTNAAFNVGNAPSVTVTSGSITATNSGFNVNNAPSVTVTSGSVTVTNTAFKLLDAGGTFQASVNASGNLFTTVQNAPSVTVTSGSITATNAGFNVNNAPSVTVTSGSITATNSGFNVNNAPSVTVTSGSVTANQGTGAVGTPWIENLVSVGGTSVAATAKGTQGTNLINVQDAKDSGRSYIALTASSVTGSTTEALVSFAVVKQGVSAAASTAYTVTTGKTLRITSISYSVRANAATVPFALLRLRHATAGTVSTTSPVAYLLPQIIASATATIGFGQAITVPIPDGMEFAAGQQICVTQIAGAATDNLMITIVGFEY